MHGRLIGCPGPREPVEFIPTPVGGLAGPPTDGLVLFLNTVPWLSHGVSSLHFCLCGSSTCSHARTLARSHFHTFTHMRMTLPLPAQIKGSQSAALTRRLACRPILALPKSCHPWFARRFPSRRIDRVSQESNGRAGCLSLVQIHIPRGPRPADPERTQRQATTPDQPDPIPDRQAQAKA